MAVVAARLADFVVLTSDNPRSEDPEAILDEVEVGIRGGATPYIRIADRREAIAEAIRRAGEGDVVLVAGKGHENYQEIAGVRHHFDDREVVREIARL
jgi:UDP-N-acetylmuramoyl-L-alanyl-D-glutamate--2,6-diaminopimelate ligase